MLQQKTIIHNIWIRQKVDLNTVTKSSLIFLGEQLFKERQYQEALTALNDSLSMGYNHHFVYNLKGNSITYQFQSNYIKSSK